MADNTTLSTMTGGDVIATDDIAGVKYQRVKVNYGADGSAIDVDATHGLPSNLVGTATFSPSDTSTLWGGSSSAMPVAPVAWNGAAFARVRVPNVFKTVTATASGDTAVWTPAAGKKFRLMRYFIGVTNDAAMTGGGDLDIVLRDATTALGVGHSLYVPATGGTGLGAYQSGWIDLGNGPLSAAANNALNINLSAALSAGKVRITVCGTEE